MKQNTHLLTISDTGLLEHLSIIACEGPNTKTFLQGQLTCDLNEVNPTQARLGCYCDQKGRVLATFYLYQKEQTYFLILAKSLVASLLKELQKYAMFSKVTLTDVSKQYQLIGSVEEIAEDSQKPKSALDVVHESQQTWLNIPGIMPRLINITSSANIPALPIHEQFWQFVDIASGIAFITPETVGLFTPHELNYQLINVVNFKKGCYRGQEIVARMHYRGKLKQHLYLATVETAAPTPGTPLVNDEQATVGTVVNSAALSEQETHLLVSLQKAATEGNVTIAQIPHASLKFLPLPYQIPE